MSEVKFHGRNTQISTVVARLRHQDTVGTQGDTVTDGHALQHDARHTQQVVVADGDTSREVGSWHQAVEVPDGIVVAHNDVVIEQIETADGDISFEFC